MGLDGIRAVVFDYNGVLVNDLEIQVDAYWRASRDLGFQMPREIVRRFISYPPDKKRTLYFGEISDEAWCRIFELKEKYYYALAETMELVFPDVRAVLPALARKYALAILSNTHRVCFDRVFPRELAAFFEESVFADEVDEPKPSPKPLMKIMKRMAIDADGCLYVGDSILDVRMAKAAGVRIFAVATGDNTVEELHEAGADCVLNRLKELTDALATDPLG